MNWGRAPTIETIFIPGLSTVISGLAVADGEVAHARAVMRLLA